MSVFEQWRIAGSNGVCGRCDVELAHGRAFFSALVEGPEGFERRDFCGDCWPDTERGEFFCYWRTRRAEPEGKPVVDTDLMMEFFDRLEGAETQEKRVFRFVLALYLMRRKQFKLVEVARGGEAESLVFERRSDKERLEVANPGIDEEQIRSAAARLSELFDAEL
ncbi:MAG: hypothetical protein R6X33_17135 [Candidatus Brocadiia bacterium]